MYFIVKGLGPSHLLDDSTLFDSARDLPWDKRCEKIVEMTEEFSKIYITGILVKHGDQRFRLQYFSRLCVDHIEYLQKHIIPQNEYFFTMSLNKVANMVDFWLRLKSDNERKLHSPCSICHCPKYYIVTWW